MVNASGVRFDTGYFQFAVVAALTVPLSYGPMVLLTHFTLTAAQTTLIDNHELEDDATTKIDEVDLGPDGRGTAFDRG